MAQRISVRGEVDLQDAVDAAARIAGLGSGYDVFYAEQELTPFESLLLEFTGSVAVRLGLAGSGLPALRNSLLENLLRDLSVLARSSAGLTIAAHCLCDVE